MRQPIKVNSYWTNLLDSNTGESVNFEEVSTWYDGTPMNDSKVDGNVYRKLPSESGGGYVRKVYNNFGELFLEKSTVAEIRDITVTETLLLQIGRYRGVKLNGYYEEGDTPAPITYDLYEGDLDDDGGEVIETDTGIKLRHDFLGKFTVAYFGALGGLTAGTNAPLINNAINAAARATGGKTIIFQEGPAMLTTGGHVVPSGIGVQMLCRLRENSSGSSNTTLMLIGDGGVTRRVNHIINIDRSSTNPRPEFESRNKTGVVFRNHQANNITIIHASLFGVAIEFRADDAGSVYNNITLTQFLNNYIHILMTNIGNGWNNDNKFFGGTINNDAAYNDYIKYGVYFESEQRTFNQNIFQGTSFEGRNLIAVFAQNCHRNKFLHCRWEQSMSTAFPVSEMGFATENPDNSRNNEYEIGYYNPNTPIRLQSATSRPVFRSKVRVVGDACSRWGGYNLIDTSGNLTEVIRPIYTRIAPDTPITYVADYPFFFTSFNTGDEVTSINSSEESQIYVYEDSVTIASLGISTRLKLNDIRKIRIHVETATGGSVQSVSVAAFEAGGTRITTNSSVSIGWTGESGNISNYNAGNFGGTWGVSGRDDVMAGFGNNVDNISIIIRGTRLRSFSVFSPEVSESAQFYSFLEKRDIHTLLRTVEVYGEYTSSRHDEHIVVDTTETGPHNITILNTNYGRKTIITDIGGNASSSPITITPSGLPFWDGDAFKVIDEDYGSKTFVFTRTGSGRGWIEIVS